MHKISSRAHATFVALLLAHVALCCYSLVLVSRFFPQHFIFFDETRIGYALVAILIATPLLIVFSLTEFSFGYFVGFYFYTMTIEFLWLSSFSRFLYDREIAELFSIFSIMVFLAPALRAPSSPFNLARLSDKHFERLLKVLIAFAGIVLIAGSFYRFRFATFDGATLLRSEGEYPPLLRYLVGITTCTLLPFTFAGFLAVRSYTLGIVSLFLMFLFYPVTLTKLSFFAAFWLLLLALASRKLDCRMTVVLSILLPIACGAVLATLFGQGAREVLFIINLRMAAVPASALDIYNDFFSKHDLTHFCQISLLKKVLTCPYNQPLGNVIQGAYGLGSFNASLFATEGIASVGMIWAPAIVFICGVVIFLGNKASAGLGPSFVLVSGGVIPHVLLNVPFSVSLVTHGLSLLFLLWHLTPRTIEPGRPLMLS